MYNVFLFHREVFSRTAAKIKKVREFPSANFILITFRES